MTLISRRGGGKWRERKAGERRHRREKYPGKWRQGRHRERRRKRNPRKRWQSCIVAAHLSSPILSLLQLSAFTKQAKVAHSHQEEDEPKGRERLCHDLCLLYTLFCELEGRVIDSIYRCIGLMRKEVKQVHA